MTMSDVTRTMITFTGPQHKFTYRIGGIAIHNGHVLCQKSTLNPDNTYWFLPGGRAELGESAVETLRREIREELGEEIQIGNLLYIVENFYTENIQQHELGLYFTISFTDDSYLYQQREHSIIRPEEDGHPMIFDWLPLEKLPHTLQLRPSFFCQELQHLPTQTAHITISENTRALE
jgi:8-oxo-dGTP pyrophosphatase MutT (NUDIX family)